MSINSRNQHQVTEMRVCPSFLKWTYLVQKYSDTDTEMKSRIIIIHRYYKLLSTKTNIQDIKHAFFFGDIDEILNPRGLT